MRVFVTSASGQVASAVISPKPDVFPRVPEREPA